MNDNDFKIKKWRREGPVRIKPQLGMAEVFLFEALLIIYTLT
jgi:hypothetical protein